MEHDKSNNCAWATEDEARALGEPPEPIKFSLDDPTLDRWLQCRLKRLENIIEKFDDHGVPESFVAYQSTLRIKSILEVMETQLTKFRYDQELFDMLVEGPMHIADETELFLRRSTE